MSRAMCSIWRQKAMVRFGVFFLIATFGLAAQLPSQTGGQPGALEITSGLGRKLYALPDDQSVIDARKGLVADPKNVDRVLQLSRRRQHGVSTERLWRRLPKGWLLLRRTPISI
jgi:hypothetical protein